MDAEAGPDGWRPRDREAVLSAMAYATEHFGPNPGDASGTRLTAAVRWGLWIICARSATVAGAQAGAEGWERDERESVLLAMRYAIDNYKPRSDDERSSADGE